MEQIVEALTDSLSRLGISPAERYTPRVQAASEANVYCHGHAATAIHTSLADLFKAPFSSFCFVAIDGEDWIYCNDGFQQLFLSQKECNRRLRIEDQSPTECIMGR